MQDRSTDILAVIIVLNTLIFGALIMGVMPHSFPQRAILDVTIAVYFILVVYTFRN